MDERDAAWRDAQWAAKALEAMLVRIARNIAGELESAAQRLRRWCR